MSTTRFTPAKRSSELRRQWGIGANEMALLYVGRISREKALADIAPLRRGLAARSIAQRFVFVGDGPMMDDLRSEHRDAIFAGTQTPDEVAVAMASSDLFIFPSRTDTAGNVVLESQASGVPVIVTDEGGPRENIEPGRSGIVCATVDEMIEHVAQLCLDRERRASMSAAAREYALGRTWEAALAPLYTSYRAVAGFASPSASDAAHSSRAPAA